MVDVDAWQILGQNETYILPLFPLFKKRLHATVSKDEVPQFW